MHNSLASESKIDFPFIMRHRKFFSMSIEFLFGQNLLKKAAIMESEDPLDAFKNPSLKSVLMQINFLDFETD